MKTRSVTPQRSWQRAGEFSSLNELCPLGYSYSCAPRRTGRGGELAAFHRDCFSTNM
ncbi:putative serine/threonine-protein kinase HAL5-like, partial [Dissostichus eleginoides]